MTTRHALALQDDLTIYHAAEIKARLIDALAACDELDIDLLQVGEIDTAGLQLLLLLKREAQRSGKSVAITAHSQVVCSTIDFCNLAAELGDPLVLPASQAD